MDNWSALFDGQTRYFLDIFDSTVKPDVLRFYGREALSEPFSWDIEFTTLQANIPPEQVLMKYASFRMSRHGEPDDTFHVRLRKALDYASTLPLKEKNVRRDFLFLEAFWPGFYLKLEVDKWLRTPNGYSAEQRVEDYKHVMINRERRGL